jgi:thiamine transport system ATP-binding protein
VTLRVEQVTVVRGATVACTDVDLVVPPCETVAVLGPSGSGKTSLLRAIAGLEPLASGRISFDGVDLAGRPPHDRAFGVVFQDLALFPHRDVAGNVGYALRVQGVAPAARVARVAELLERVGLAGFERRAVPSLSGGERQRVAIARMLASGPRLMLLDEPLGALDRPRRDDLIAELRALIAGCGLPALVVTHDHDEAFALASHVVLLREGRVVQAGPPAEVWRAPATEWVSDFIGNPPAVDAGALGGRLTTPWGAIDGAWRDGRHRVVVPPSAVTVGVGDWTATVVAARPDRWAFAVELEAAGGARLRAEVRDAPALGSTVRLAVDAGRVLAWPSAGAA